MGEKVEENKVFKEQFARMCEISKADNARQFADRIEIQPESVYGAINREQIPKTWFFELRERFGVNIEWILSGDGPKLLKEPNIKDGFVTIPQINTQLSEDGKLVPDNRVDLRVAFREEWIRPRGRPESMSVMRIYGDSMQPTLQDGDLVLINHDTVKIRPNGGLYAIETNGEIFVRECRFDYISQAVNILNHNSKFGMQSIDPKKINIKGLVIWMGRELER